MHAGIDGAAGILNDGKMVMVGNTKNYLHVRAIPREIDRKNGTRSRGDRFFNEIHINGERVVDIHEYWRGPHTNDRPRRGNERAGHRDDFVPRADPQGF